MPYLKKISFFFLMISFLIAASSCSSKKETYTEVDHSDTIKKDFIVTDASSNIRPGWTQQPEIWAKDHGMNIKKFRYFTYETTPKVDRQIACSVAKSRSRLAIAQEISTFIENTLGINKEGGASIDENNPIPEAMREYVSETLSERTKNYVQGASAIRTYWEKRRYKKDLGAVKDYTGYTCATLVRMGTNRLKNAINRATKNVIQKAKENKVDKLVKEKLKSAPQKFIQEKQNQLI